jgi:Helix-turn-helix
MEQNKNLENFLGLVSNEQSGLLDKLQWRANNQVWLERSAKIAIRILSKLRENRTVGKYPSSQKELAELMQVTPQQVNKIVRGSENLTLETIVRLEQSLSIILVEIPQDVATNSFLLVDSPYTTQELSLY